MSKWVSVHLPAIEASANDCTVQYRNCTNGDLSEFRRFPRER
ncbi:hypothetical protein A176_005052 [Myxococcus hansupus]|uniref:Uncharacterized protein n=1 Tax=Pseudomyxococcus hansupus TaxID=1297742 RepID=A0A0H4X3C7_9BACT|nr:hypothetical protein A176_005052 [Myxococcus hansupus]